LPRGGCTVTGEVRIGSDTADVLCVERVLAGLDYQFAGPDGVMDAAVVNSLKDYQRRNGLRADGVLGAATGRKLLIWPTTATAPATAPTPGLPDGWEGTPLPRGGCTVSGAVRVGSSPVDVLCVERVLAGLNYQFAGPDGVMDAAVVNSLRDYQRRNRLRVDGTVSAATGQALLIWPGSPSAPAPSTPMATIPPQLPLPLGGCTITAPVRLDTTGPDALCAEQVLAGIGYQFPGPDDHFGIDSVNSVKAFQAGKGIRPDGVLGAATASILGIWPGTVPQADAPAPAPQSGAFGLPANSGSGRRIVYSRGQQRVWAVEADGTVVKTHLVSGRLREPYAGTYRVYSRSMYTYSTENPNVKWRYMVRFAHGPGGGRIGFHEIPNKNGVPMQSYSQLGQPLSGGCVRQTTGDAIWMWNWAGLGTTVVVL
jgi:peptidoglycan hydrolase-like protein with peptidoglycan-binding domain